MDGGGIMECITTGKLILPMPFAQPVKVKITEKKKIGLILRRQNNLMSMGIELVEPQFYYENLMVKVEKLMSDSIYKQNLTKMQAQIK